MTHIDTHHEHPVGRGFLLFGLSATAVGWTIFLVWMIFMQVVDLARS